MPSQEIEEGIEGTREAVIEHAFRSICTIHEDYVKTLVGSAVKVRDDRRAILQIGVHYDHPIAVGVIDASRDGRVLAEIAREADTDDTIVRRCKRGDAAPGIVPAAVGAEDNFE